MNFEPWKRSLSHYLRWLKERDRGAARRFVDRVGSDTEERAEGAVGEALAWDFLDNRELRIELAETGGGGPDFRCSSQLGHFYAEATNLSRAFVARETNLPKTSRPGAGFYGNLTRAIKGRIIKKAKQFSQSDLDAPLLIFVTTLHAQATALCTQRAHIEELLLGGRSIAWHWDPNTGDSIGKAFLATDMRHSLATKTRSLDVARQHLSAVLVAGFAYGPRRVEARGVLMPVPIRPFDRTHLIDVEFCRFRNWPARDSLEIEWLGRPPRPRRPVSPEIRALAEQILDRKKRGP